MEPEAEVFEDRANLFVGRWGNCGLVIWRQTPTLETAQLASEYFDRFAPEPGHGFALVAIITPACAPVGPDVRASFAAAMRRHGSDTLGMAAVIEVSGVLGGLTRALARTMSVVSRSSYPTNVFANAQGACTWVCPLLSSRGGAALDPGQLERFIAEHRDYAA